jgi:hypothetical protein
LATSRKHFVELTPDEKVAILLMDDSNRCECGWLLAYHPALPKVGPFSSWGQLRRPPPPKNQYTPTPISYWNKR